MNNSLDEPFGSSVLPDGAELVWLGRKLTHSLSRMLTVCQPSHKISSSAWVGGVHTHVLTPSSCKFFASQFQIRKTNTV